MQYEVLFEFSRYIDQYMLVHCWPKNTFVSIIESFFYFLKPHSVLTI